MCIRKFSMSWSCIRSTPLVAALLVLAAILACQTPADRRPVARETGPDPAQLIADGRLALDDGEYGRAEGLFEKGLELDPDHSEAEALLARALYLNGDLTSARSRIQAHLSRHSEDVDALVLAGQILLALYSTRGENASSCLDSAEKLLVKAVSVDPTAAVAHVLLGDCRLYGGESAGAIAAYKDGITRCPAHRETHLCLEACFRNGALITPAEGVLFYRTLLEGDIAASAGSEGTGTLWWFLGVWYDNLGRKAYENEQYEEAAEAYAECGRCHRKAGEIHLPFAADALYEEAQACANMGWARFYSGRYGSAEKMFAKALSIEPKMKNAIIGMDYLGAAIIEREGNVKGRDFYRRIAYANPWNANWWNGYARLCRDTGLYEEAYTGYARAMKLSPEECRYANDAGVMLMDYLKREPGKAESLFRTAWKTGEEKCGSEFLEEEERQLYFEASCDAMLNLGRLLLIQNRIGEAEPVITSLQQKAPERQGVKQLLADLKAAKEEKLYKSPE